MAKFLFPKSNNEKIFEGNENRNSKLEAVKHHMVESKPPFKATIDVHGPATILAVRKLSEHGKQKSFWEHFKQRFHENIWWRHLFAGGVAGGLSRTVTAPMDRVKIYTQVHPHTMSLYGCVKHLVKEGGVLSLWRGNGVNVLKIMPESAIKFTAYEKVKRIIRYEKNRDISADERFMAGAIAGGLAQTCVYPLEVLKVRLALMEQYVRLGDVTRNMFRREGPLSFYRGFLPNILGSVPYGGIEFTTYETLKREYIHYFNLDGPPSFFILAICSSISTTVGQCCVYPMALARTRLQAGVVEDGRLISVFRAILRNDGILGLYRGIVPNILKVVPAVSINFVAYEYVSSHLGIHMT